MKIKVISDSTGDIPQELLTQYDIDLTPLTIIKGDGQFRDLVDITPADIFSHVAAGGDLCTTSAVSVGEYQEKFRQYSQSYEGVVQVTIGSGFSACYRNASIAAADFPNVRVVDSANLCCGQGLVALEAARLAPDCGSLDELTEKLQDFIPRVEISFLLDRLEYMVKGGRCSSATALGANLLNLKPCIEVRDGKMTVVKKYRGNYAKCLATYIKDRLDQRTDIDRRELFFIHTVVTPECRQAAWNATEQYGHFDAVHPVIAGSTISCHCGPGTLGIAFVRK